ncbi:MAG: HD domain-containing protein [Betaproteobacteria bacterium]|nr:HD domain-containing protein [Betaproteobacteria bacterium]
MALTLPDIAEIFRARGHEQYTGEPVSHLEHALQSATLAQEAGASDGLVTAALLHDLGHLLHDLGANPTLSGTDDLHQYRAVPFLRHLFAPEVITAIRLHVDAKRYLCATRPDYYDNLSEDSKRSLVLQGGIFSTKEQEAFISEPGAADAVKVRLWDDKAKTPNRRTPDLEHFLRRAQRCCLFT